MSPLGRRGGALWVVALVLVASGCRTLPPGVRVEGARAQVEVRETVGPLLAALESGQPVQEAWLAWESQHAPLLEAADAGPGDPGDAMLHKLAAGHEALVALLRSAALQGPDEVRGLTAALETKLGPLPPVVLAFGASRETEPVFHGRVPEDGRPLVLFNVRSPRLAEPGARQAAIARELFAVWQRTALPEGERMGPLARAVWREGASHFAARTTVSDLRETELFGLDEKRLSTLRARVPLLAKELLAGLDSGSEAEAARFFSLDVRDPLLPPGAGPFIAERLYQRLAADLGSVDRPLRLSPAEFLQRARPALQALAVPQSTR